MSAAAPPAVAVALRDGSTVSVRPVTRADEPALLTLLEDLSPDSRWLRFLGTTDLERAAHAAAGGQRGLVATAGDPGRIVGHAEYFRHGGHAEVVFEVAEDHQGLGIATILLAHLAEAAEREGVHTFTALVRSANRKMIQVFRDSGFAVRAQASHGVLFVKMPASLDPAARRRFEDRDRIAAVAAVTHLLRPASVAVIGASAGGGGIGAAVLGNLQAGSFAGPLYLIHPHADEIAGVPAYRSVAHAPGPVELAVVAVPSEAVPAVARDCGAAGVRALIVLSAGFAEIGERGTSLQGELLQICRAAGMRLLGPNCLGALNTPTGLNATFSPQPPTPGRIAYASQSGAFGIAAMAEAARRGVGLSSFVSLGDKADLSGNDFLRYWAQDPDTDVILLYLESFGNPRRFGTIARSVAAHKPIVAVRSGRSAAGARAAASHTGALLAASDVTVDALFADAGVIRADTLGEQLDVASLLTGQPLPAGPRVGIVTNAGGPGIACAVACAAAGLRVDPLGEAARRRLRRRLPAQAAVGNPVDMIASATPEDFRKTVELLAAEPEFDAVVSIFIPPLVTRSDDVGEALRLASKDADKPVLRVFMGEADAPRTALARAASVPVFGTPEEAARALGHAVRYATWRLAGVDAPPALAGVDADAAAAVVAEGLAAGGGWLAPERVEAVLRAYGIPVAESRRVATAADAGRAAAELGGPVAIKAIAPGLVHKSDAGGVALGARGETAASRAARRVARAVERAAGAPPEAFLVQRLLPPGTELIVGMVGDPDFGPVVACGAGGRAVELLGDVAVRLAPLSRRTASEMLRSLRTFPLLDGYRGAPCADLAAVEDVLLRVSALAAAHPEIAELDCNPLIAGPDGAAVADARIRLAPVAPRRPFPALDR